jgi:single-stranded DNA-binding protein
MDGSDASANNKKIANPYLAANSRRRSPQTLPDSFELPGHDGRTEALADNDDLKQPSEQLKQNEQSVSDEKKGDQISAESSIPNNGLEYWERLPSKNLTFGSAEILTVEECIKYRDLYKGRAVRVTGQLRQRSFVDDDDSKLRQVLLELVHIETKAQSVMDRKSPPETLVFPAATPAKSLSESKMSYQKVQLKTPTLGMRKPLLTSSDRPTLSSRRKRPWFATSSSKKVSPKRSSSTAPTLLKVLVDPELPNLSEIVPSVTTKVTVLGTMLENGSIQARFVVLVDAQLDMNLYMTALLRRRRCLYQRLKRLQQQAGSAEQSPDDPTKEEILIQGCGPPPYDKLLQD